MENFNYSSIFHGSPENIHQIESYLRSKDEGGFIEDENIIFVNLEYRIDKEKYLTLFFECNINTFKWLKKIAKKFNLDVNCNISEGMIYGNYFAIRTFRYNDGIDKKYELKQKHYSKVEIINNDNENRYIFNGKEYDNSDVPLILCEDMIYNEYGEKNFSFN